MINQLTNINTGRGYTISFESPKDERLSLFKLGERSYDHLLLTPPKSKGQPLGFLTRATLIHMKAMVLHLRPKSFSTL